MRIEECAASYATKTRTRHQGVLVTEDVPSDVFLLAGASALFALELPVEGGERFLRGRQLVCVPFDGLPGELGVHFDQLHALSIMLSA
jgi:hypothetical protein